MVNRLRFIRDLLLQSLLPVQGTPVSLFLITAIARPVVPAVSEVSIAWHLDHSARAVDFPEPSLAVPVTSPRVKKPVPRHQDGHARAATPPVTMIALPFVSRIVDVTV
jgi:hypothetical protein